MTVDFYRHRLKHAKWTWRESHSWDQGKFRKDRASGRIDKRGARQDERREIAEQLAETRPKDRGSVS